MAVGMAPEVDLRRPVEIWRRKDPLQKLKKGKLRSAIHYEPLLARGGPNVKVTLEEQLGSGP